MDSKQSWLLDKSKRRSRTTSRAQSGCARQMPPISGSTSRRFVAPTSDTLSSTECGIGTCARHSPRKSWVCPSSRQRQARTLCSHRTAVCAKTASSSKKAISKKLRSSRTRWRRGNAKMLPFERRHSNVALRTAPRSSTVITESTSEIEVLL